MSDLPPFYYMLIGFVAGAVMVFIVLRLTDEHQQRNWQQLVNDLLENREQYWVISAECVSQKIDIENLERLNAQLADRLMKNEAIDKMLEIIEETENPR